VLRCVYQIILKDARAMIIKCQLLFVRLLELLTTLSKLWSQIVRAKVLIGLFSTTAIM
jgi:hypothetical protein